ncbi:MULTISPECIES: hypothetical protein [unclassified Microcystis]|jgi:hypothetical protein|uniref:hypothetical protein n=1 Tax=unclassified Microcystis TaxID=2643300 RepID=UPI0022C42596|nr:MULTISPECIES: hypothetical protein [unclassified Microcystis]MCA2818558.1 hypothetical protein [Microcystis sp. M085S1]MCA2853431.1 hypothetical protein [Microcystis sp. M065S1]MCZ8054122.1 hypothetical protein [Microcystis sp. LE19-12.2C]MDJ0548966.1 hypothetical protein [Microcystis sp. M49637_WE12]MCA2626998.1 hypothetical protein [Microcystis sp. M091S2]
MSAYPNQEVNFLPLLNYRAFDLYQKPVISLAILGDERVNWRPDSYNYLIF